MQDYLNEMLNLTADIAEELLTLKDTDRDVTPALCDKISRLATLANDNVTTEPETIAETIAETNVEVMPEVATVVMPEFDQSEELLDASAFEEAQEAIDEEIPEIAVAEEPKEVKVAEEPNEFKVAEEPEKTEESTKTDEPEVADEVTEPASEPNSDNIGNTPLIDVLDLKAAFSLNDIFLFRRTLFGGSAQRFNNALADIACMDSTAQLKRYLQEQHGINIRSAEAKEFISVVEQFFPYN
jgi:chemotaxis protein histidine kinase CheA